MTQRVKRLKKWMIALLAVVALGFNTACEEDNNLRGTEIVGDKSLISEPDATASVVAFSKQLKGIRTNTQQSDKSGMMGVYKDPVFGKTTMNFLTQLRLSRTNPSFGDGARIDSVKLHLPYYSRTKIEADTTYILDSIYAHKPMKIEVFESNYFLREMDPNSNFEGSQVYFSDQTSVFENHLGTKIGEIENFYPNSLPVVHVSGEGDDKKKEGWEPGVYMNLSTSFFEEKILNKEGAPELVSNESFADYFRGIYFKVSGINEQGSMFLFKMDQSIIRIYHSIEAAESDENKITGFFDLNLQGGTKVEAIEKENSSYVQQQLSAQDTIRGSSRLLLQGGESIVSVINLFGKDSDNSGVPDELEQLRLDRPIVNEANLVLYVDQDAIGNQAIEPERIIIFNANNGRVLQDYVVDQSASANTLGSKVVHLGRLHRDKNGKGEYYKIRITNYISDLINGENDNVPLGIAVVPNVEVANPIVIREVGNAPVKGIPSGAVFSPRGTVIHGPTSENVEKRLKLELYLTKIN